MFIYWMHMNMLVNGFDPAKIEYNVGKYTAFVWDMFDYDSKRRVVLSSIEEDILGAGAKE